MTSDMDRAVKDWARATGRPDISKIVQPDVALLVALCTEGGHTLDVGRCSCEPWRREGGTRGGYVKRRAAEQFAQLVQGRVVGSVGNYSVEWPPHRICSGTGRDVRPAWALVLGAAPRKAEYEYMDWLTKPPHGPGPEWEFIGLAADIDTVAPGERARQLSTRPGGHAYPYWHRRAVVPAQPGDASARESLEILATRLQTEGAPLGDWLLAWLMGRDGWQVAATEALRTCTIERSKN